jgi:DNA-binding protein H-NS
VVSLSVGELIRQLLAAKEHLGRAAALIGQAIEELGKAENLIRHTLTDSSDQTLPAMPTATRQQLTDAIQHNTQTVDKLDQTIARWTGQGK